MAGSLAAAAIASVAVTRRRQVSVPADAPGVIERDAEGMGAVKGEGEEA